jgi:CheY-like chemotaxis protein
MKVLIVEDNPVNAEMIRHTLEKDGYEPVLAEDGETALAQLEAHPDVELVITDVMMPNVDGLEMLGRMRKRPEFKTLPVVMATSQANSKTVRQAVSLHCKHFIVKPFTVQLLLQTVREAIGQRGCVLEDKNRVLGRIGIDTGGYDQLVQSFAAFVRARIAALDEICAREKPAELDMGLRRDLFALEESATLLGAERVSRLLTAFGLPSGNIPAAELAGTYKAILAELRRLEGQLPGAAPAEPPAPPADAEPAPEPVPSAT